MRKSAVFIFGGLFILMATGKPLFAREPITGPIFTDYGPVFKVTEKDVPLKKGFVYKAVFDISKNVADPERHNGYIESVARYINMHAINGVALSNMDIAVILHSKASYSGLTNSAYMKRYGVNNPSIELIEQLTKKGVKFYQCGQSAYFNGIEKSEMIDSVQLGLSAMTLSTELQASGYQLLQ